MRKKTMAFVVTLGISLAASCTALEKAKLRPETVLAPIPCALDTANYSKQLYAASAKKARELNAAAASESSASLTAKHAAPIDTLLINGVN